MDKEYIDKIRETIRVFEREIFYQNTASCCNGVSLAQCHTILEIGNNSEISVSELAQKLDLDKSTVSRTVDGLVKMDIIDRKTPEENRRKALLNLTDEGYQVCESINYSNDSYINDVFEGFSEQDRSVFLELFGKLTENMVQARKNSEEKEGG